MPRKPVLARSSTSTETSSRERPSCARPFSMAASLILAGNFNIFFHGKRSSFPLRCRRRTGFGFRIGLGRGLRVELGKGPVGDGAFLGGSLGGAVWRRQPRLQLRSRSARRQSLPRRPGPASSACFSSSFFPDPPDRPMLERLLHGVIPGGGPASSTACSSMISLRIAVKSGHAAAVAVGDHSRGQRVGADADAAVLVGGFLGGSGLLAFFLALLVGLVGLLLETAAFRRSRLAGGQLSLFLSSRSAASAFILSMSLRRILLKMAS